MFIGTNTHNLGQLLYHYLAINLLSKAEYGDLAALVSIFGLVAIVQQSLALAIVKFIASSKDEAEAKNLSRWFFLWGLRVAGALAVFIIIIAPFLSDFLHISQRIAVYLFAPTVAVAFVSNTGRALLQGFVKFIQLSGSMVVEVTFKIVFTVTFLFLGYALLGAVIGLLVGVIVGLFVVWVSLKSRLKGEREPILRLKAIFRYSLPVLAQSIAVTSMVSTDLLLVKHFFHPDIAGAYAALAKFGTISLFAAAPITQVMFPLIAKKHSHGEPYHRIFYLSLLMISFVSALIVSMYYFFGYWIVEFLTSGKYVQESYLLWRLGLYMFLLGLAMLFTQFYLSVGKTRIVWVFAAAAFLQAVLILFFHGTLLSVVQVSIISAALLVISLSIYFPYHDKQKLSRLVS